MISTINRLGFHYFPDTLHYRELDLQTWLPELRRLGAAWVTLLAPNGRAIPEGFLRGLLEAEIQPILQFQLPAIPIRAEMLRVLFRNYARWGVRYVSLFDRPNSRESWSPATWAQADLVERFLDLYLPLAETALEEGVIPVFPPLEPGGDYWDLAFLRTSLRSLMRRGQSHILDNSVLGAYAWAGNRPLDWGAGGSERWPGTRPYADLPGVENHLGFYIFDWYLAVCQEELGRALPILLIKAGCRLGDHTDPDRAAIDEAAHAQQNMALVQQALGYGEEARSYEPLPKQVLACNFWLLAAEQNSAEAEQAWFQVGGKTLPVVDAMRRWMGERQTLHSPLVVEESWPTSPGTTPLNSPFPIGKGEGGPGKPEADTVPSVLITRPISHYVLLPLYAWGAAEWSLDLIQPLLQQARPTVGFSLDEARLATRVTVVGGVQAFPEQSLAELRREGCTVERILEDGTVVAT
jgi:hypothetical protein